VHLSDPEDAVGELGGDASSPSSACIPFPDWRASAKTVLIEKAREKNGENRFLWRMRSAAKRECEP